MSFATWSIGRKIGVLVAGVVFANAVAGGFGLLQAQRLHATEQRADELVAAEQIVGELLLGIDRAERNVLSFMLSGDSGFVDAYRAELPIVEQRFTDLRGMVDGNDAGLTASLDVLEEGFVAWRRDHAERQIAAMLDPLTIDLARALGTSSENLAITEALDQQATALAQTIEGQFDVARADREGALAWAGAAVIAMVVLAIVGGLLTGLLLRSGVVRPLAALCETVDRLARKDWAADVVGAERGDEIGRLARALQQFRSAGQDADRLAAEQETAHAAQSRRVEEIDRLTRAFETQTSEMVQGLAGAATELLSASEAMLATAEDTAERCAEMSEAAADAGVNVRNAASVASDLSGSVHEINARIGESNATTETAESKAQSAVATVRELHAAASHIGQVVEMIATIAAQTNLLALNATIEAARAGEAGRGFAVVANEVKTLAGQAAAASEQIAEGVRSIQGSTEGAVAAMSDVVETIGDLRAAASAIAQSVVVQDQATQEITQAVQSAAGGSDGVQARTETVRDGAGRATEAATGVRHASAEVSQTAERLRNSVDRFLGDMRATGTTG